MPPHSSGAIAYNFESSEGVVLERVMGIEPTFLAWEANVLPLNYTRGRLIVRAAQTQRQMRGRKRYTTGSLQCPACLLDCRAHAPPRPTCLRARGT